MNTNDAEHSTPRLPIRNRSRAARAPAPLRRDLPAVTFTLSPGALRPLHYRVHAADYAEQCRLERWTERAWELLELLSQECAA